MCWVVFPKTYFFFPYKKLGLGENLFLFILFFFFKTLGRFESDIFCESFVYTASKTIVKKTIVFTVKAVVFWQLAAFY